MGAILCGGLVVAVWWRRSGGGGLVGAIVMGSKNSN
jgi:hypothetical protein